jgi:hypothetical protein
MKGIFCVTNDGADVAIKMAAFVAGAKIAGNNKDLTAKILPAAVALMATVDGNPPVDVMNSLFAQGVTELKGVVTDPLLQAAVDAVLTSVKLNPTLASGGVAAQLANPVIKDLVDGFVQGMQSVK